MASIFDWNIQDAQAIARTVGPFLPDPLNFTTREFVACAELAAGRHPNEWAIFYQLGDKYQELGELARSLQAAKRCIELRPKDIRSAYALATAYNLLTRAEWVGIQRELETLRKILPLDLDPAFDPSRSRTEMEEMGMVVDTAASQAIRWFERALQSGPDRASATAISEDLAALYSRFPHLRY